MTRVTRYDPTTHALALGLHIIEHPLPDDVCAHYYADERTIVIRPGIDPARRRSAIAHEVQHALHDHPECRGREDTTGIELVARIATARILVSIPALALARWQHGDDHEALAEYLHVSHSVLRDWFQFIAPAAGIHRAA